MILQTLPESSEKVSEKPSPHRITIIQEETTKTEKPLVISTPNRVVKKGRPKKNGTIQKISKSKTVDVKNTLMQYFPVRRSNRKCLKTVIQEKKDEIERKVIEGCEDGLQIAVFPEKGRGIVTAKEFEKGDFVVEYAGMLIDHATAKKNEAVYAANKNTGCYMYYFEHRNKNYCIDATEESGKLGRLINHSRNGNLDVKVIEIQDIPHLVLVANKNIPIGVEVLYDYGDRSRESLLNYPWLAL